MDVSNYRSEFKKAILELNRLDAMRLHDVVEESERDIDFIEDVMVPVLEEIGDGWENGENALSQLYMSGKICEEIIDSKFVIPDTSSVDNPAIAIVTLDYHTLGKKIVYSLLKVYGYEILDYGHGINDETLVKKVIEDKIEILLISVLMLSSALRVKDVVKQLRDKGMKTKVLVGGAPFRFDKNLWKEIEVNAACRNAKEADAIISKWMEEL